MRLVTWIARAFILSLILVVASGCPSLGCDFECPEDREIPDFIEDGIPYISGDFIKFVNEEEDTLSFKCVERNNADNPGFLNDQMEQECCESYFIRGFECLFLGNQLKIKCAAKPLSEQPELTCLLILGIDTIRGKWFYNYAKPDLIGQVELAGETFTNVAIGNQDSTIFYGREPNLGIIGFKAKGKEWRKIN